MTTPQPWVARYTLLGPAGERITRVSELPDERSALHFIAICHLLTSCVMATAAPKSLDSGTATEQGDTHPKGPAGA